MKMKTEYIEISADKYKKDSYSKHTNSSSHKVVKIPVNELKNLMD